MKTAKLFYLENFPIYGMRQTTVCINRAFKFYIYKICIPGAHTNFCACKKVCSENQKKQTNKEIAYI